MPRRFAPLALVSAVVLAFEVFLTKLVSYTVDTMLIYVVLGVAMLGSGAAGSLVAVRRGWLDEARAPRVVARAAAWFSLSLVVAPALYARNSPLVATSDPRGGLVLAGLMALPFLAAGVVVATALSTARDELPRAYAWDLCGAALGCFLPLVALGPLDAARFLCLLSALAWVAALAYARQARAGWRSGEAAVLIASALTLAAALSLPRWVFPIRPEPGGQEALYLRAAAEKGVKTRRLFDRWGAIGHIGVVEYRGVPGAREPYPFRSYAQDGSATSMLVRWDGKPREETPDGSTEVSRLCTETAYAQGYLRDRPRVLIIGLGGGPDVQCALFLGARSVDVVEINPTTIAAMTGPFDAFLGGIGRDRRVRYHARDGRSFARASRGAGYDLVQLSGVDTKQLLATGALSLSENHLYTREAFDDYLASLSDTGVLSILRFGEPELMRLVSTAVDALRRAGVAHPTRHLLVLRNDPIVGLLVSRAPLRDADVAAFVARYDPATRPFGGGVTPFFYEVLTTALREPPRVGWTPGSRGDDALHRYLGAVDAGTDRAFEATFPSRLSPTDDDRPFFFDLYPLVPTSPHAAAHRLLWLLVSTVALLAVVFVLLPVWPLRKRGGAPAVAPLYFGAVGLGYLFVEVWLLHRFGMFLGHQTYALCVVLASLLLGTGLGAAWGERWHPSGRVRAAAASVAVACVVAALTVGLGPALRALGGLPFAARGAVVAAACGGLGLLMGLPFPAGLAWIQRAHPVALPWCIGINSFASVLASVLVSPLCLRLGYTSVAWLAIGAYLLAAVLSPALGGGAARRGAGAGAVAG
ncbi:MAG: hypothetical protein IT374_19465 [Polyangiaceae bacterium]|nr:hypothetical protein [Polyangiaceae bacterium]